VLAEGHAGAAQNTREVDDVVGDHSGFTAVPLP
jgi:hypothetical protein